MSFDTSWDVERYKSDFESEEHWELRKNFMLAHKQKFSEERLVCLAQVFFNVEFLGCKYPEKTMKLVEELSKEVAAEHRELQKTKLQRTFVKASDAAGARIKGIKRDAESNLKVKSNDDDECAMERRDGKQDYKNDESRFIHDTLGNRFEKTLSNFGEKRPRFGDNYNQRNTNKQYITLDEIKRTTGPCGSMVVFFREGDNAASTLHKTAQEWKKQYQCHLTQDNYLWIARIIFDNVELSSSSDTMKAVAKERAAQLAVDKLMQSYYSVKIKRAFFGGDKLIKKSGIKRICEDEKEDGTATLNPSSEDGVDEKNEQQSPFNATDIDTPLEDGNVGLKLLKMMGWSGGGLGKNQQGISEPIKPSSSGKNRAGFGSEVKDNAIKVAANENLNHIKKIVRDYKFSNNFQDLVFSPEFTKEQRSMLHKYAQKLGLKTRSYGSKKNEKDRHLVIFKRIDNWTIIDGLAQNVDQFYNKYELLRPGEHTDMSA